MLNLSYVNDVSSVFSEIKILGQDAKGSHVLSTLNSDTQYAFKRLKIVSMGDVETQAEADAAINVARTTSGVKRVVNLMEIISPAKAREIDVVQKSSGNGKPAEVRNP